MKRAFFVATIFLISISSFGQTVRNLNVYCTDNFDPNASITVKSPEKDDLIVTDALKNSLVRKGFKVISETVAKEKIELINKKQINDTTVNQEVSVGKTTYIKSIYVITFNYSEYLTHSDIADLNGQVVDMANDGIIVATFSFHQGAFGSKKMSTITDALAQALKEKQKSK
jgi:hypothetical protein